MLICQCQGYFFLQHNYKLLLRRVLAKIEIILLACDCHSTQKKPPLTFFLFSLL